VSKGQIKIATWNAGARTPAFIRDMVMDMFGDGVAAVGCQEMGDQREAKRMIVNQGMLLVDGDRQHAGSLRDCVFLNPALVELHGYKILHRCMRLRQGSTAAAGGHIHHGKFGPKYFVGIEVIHKPTGRTPIIGSNHPVPSIHLPKQKPLFQEHIGNLASYTSSAHGLVIETGDYNARWKEPMMAPLRKVGLHSNQGDLKEIGTHGKPGKKRAIDQVLMNMHRATYVSHETITMPRLKNGLWDHDALVVTIQLG
jgi:hypothetical protein